MTTYHIVARGNIDGEVYIFQIRKEGKGFFLYDLLASDKVPVNYYPKTKKALKSAIECACTIMEVTTF